MLGLLIWQVILGHTWGKHPMSNGDVIGWTIFLWLVYFRLITVRLVTEVQNGKLTVALQGLWRSRRVPLTDIHSVEVATIDPVRDYGGYGIRSTRQGKAYIAAAKTGVRLTLASGEKLVVGTERPEELVTAVRLPNSGAKKV
jgi:hypothetical protein